MTDSWRRQAACRGMDPNLFFPPENDRRQRPSPETRQQTADALAVCAGCPVQEPCLDEALIEDRLGRYGIRGGHTAAERAEIADRRRHNHLEEAS